MLNSRISKVDFSKWSVLLKLRHNSFHYSYSTVIILIGWFGLIREELESS